VILTTPELGLVLLVLFAVFYWRGILPTVTALAGFLAVILLGTAGWLGRILTDIGTWFTHLTNTATSDIVGAAVPALAFIALIVLYAYDLHPRHQTMSRTAWFGVALGVLIVGGLTGIPALAGLHAGIVHSATHVLQVF
jgi:hypothetical protein